MFATDQYALLDFGGGRKLERFAGWVLDRPCPAANRALPCRPELWAHADASFVRSAEGRDAWEPAERLPEAWPVRHPGFSLQLKPTEFGHLGLFPEQAVHWDWLRDQVRGAEGRLRVLNLFAYTGASTLACAAAGAEVAHVDAARNVVAWARRNAALSGLDQAPIRWLAEDALRFVGRELKRGRRYDAVVLDPPTYGHGPRGEVWKIDEHLPELLVACARLMAASRRFALLTCHTPEYTPKVLARLLGDALGKRSPIECGVMELTAAGGAALPSGAFARVAFR